MFEVILGAITVTAAVSTVLVCLRTFLRGPHIGFELEKAEISFDNPEGVQNATLLIARIANQKRRFVGDTARKLSGMIRYRAPSENDWRGLNASAGLPWLRPSQAHIRIDKKLRLDEDFEAIFETRLFERMEKDIPQGRGEILAVAYGIEQTNRLFFASNPPIEIPLPPPEEHEIIFASCPLRLEVAGENLSSKSSEGTVILVKSWKEWTHPKTVMTLQTPSRIRNLLLRVGIGRKIKVLGSEKS